MTEEENKLYHKQKSHEHYMAHKEEYRQRQKARKEKDPEAYAKYKKASRSKHRENENLQMAKKRYEAMKHAELSGEIWLPSEDERLAELYEEMRQKKIRQVDIARMMGRSLSAIANRAKKIGLTHGYHYE